MVFMKSNIFQGVSWRSQEKRKRSRKWQGLFIRTPPNKKHPPPPLHNYLVRFLAWQQADGVMKCFPSLYPLCHWQAVGNISLLETVKLANADHTAWCHYKKKTFCLGKRWLLTFGKKLRCATLGYWPDVTHCKSTPFVHQTPIPATDNIMTMQHFDIC